MIIRYNSMILDYFHHPRQSGAWDSADEQVATGKAGNLAIGEIVQLQCKWHPTDQRITDTRVKAYGNPCTMAAASFTAEWLIGKTSAQAKTWQHNHIVDALQLPPTRLHSAIIVEDALIAMLAKIRGLANITIPQTESCL